MFKLYKLNDDKYLIYKANGSDFEGNQTEIIKHLLINNVAENEISYGLEALIHDDVADYGVNKMFIFSKKLA